MSGSPMSASGCCVGSIAGDNPVDKQFLNCHICSQHYKDPKVLPCLHSFCGGCLTSYIPINSLTLTCPTCRQQSILPQEGVGELQDNTFLSSLVHLMQQVSLCKSCDQDAGTYKCLHCNTFLCDRCMLRHREIESMEDHQLMSLSDFALGRSEPSSQLLCPNHSGQILEIYCRDCEMAMCAICIELEHQEHLNLPLQKAIEEHKEELRRQLDKVYSQVPVVKEAIEVVTKISEDVAARRVELEEKINHCFEKLTLLLKQRQMTLLNELEDVHNHKQKTLAEQKEQLEKCLANMSSSCEFTEKALSRGSETQVLLVRKQMEEMLTQYSQLQIQHLPEENNHIIFSVSELNAAIKCLSNIGLIESNSAIAFESTASGEGLRRCIVGQKTAISITTKDRRGEPVKVGSSILNSELKCASTGLCHAPTTIDHNNGTYDLLYTAPKEGHYLLTILLFGQHIKGSPFSVRSYSEEEMSNDQPVSKIPRTTGVKQRSGKRTPSAKSSSSCNRCSNLLEDELVMRVGCKGRNRGEFTNPQGICCSVNTGRIIVTDSNNQCVQVFSEQGECKVRFGIRGRSAGQVQRPTGVVCLPSGNYAVADYDNKWVSVFEPSGKYVSRMGIGKLLGPKGLAVDRNGNLIVVDNKASVVFIFEPNGKLIHKFGSRGNGEQQFAGPHFVSVDSKNRLAITDFHNHCVKLFNAEGEFLSRFGSNGEGNGQFNAPTGISFDRQDNLVVADWGNSRIQVFDSNGSFLSYVNTMAHPLYGPQGLAVTEDGHILIADSGNHCFKMYKYLQ